MTPAMFSKTSIFLFSGTKQERNHCLDNVRFLHSLIHEIFLKYHLFDSLYLYPQSTASLYYHKSRGDDPQPDFIFGSDNQIISVRRETNFLLVRH